MSIDSTSESIIEQQQEQLHDIGQTLFYKIYILDSQGKPTKIIVFSGGLKNKTHEHELFSDIEISENIVNQTEILFSDFLLLTDDSIRIVKKKIINEIGQDKLSYDEIYMFAFINEFVNLEKLYKNIVKPVKNSNVPKELEMDQFGQLVKNLNITDEIADSIDVKSVYTYEDILTIGQPTGNNHIIETSIGQRFMEYRDYLFSANPFKIRNTSTSRFEISQQNPILTFENELLLNYGTIISKKIYVCLAEFSYEYAFKTEIDAEYLTALYYPHLFTKGIRSTNELVQRKGELLRNNAQLMTAKSMQLYKTVDMFYKISQNKTVELPYLERGVQSFSLVLKSGFDTNIPLETIFKNVHALKQIPFIKYNPGNRRENMYRLYSELVSKNGKKIPFISESMIMKLSRETGKRKQISLYNPEMDLYIDFESNGNVYIRSVLKTPLSYDALTDLMIQHVNPVIQVFNTILQSTGLAIALVKSMKDKHIEFLNIKYVLSISTVKVLSIAKYTSCISSIFNIISDDLTKEVRMQFKRVENFKEMNALSELITTVLKHSNDYQEVVRLLMLNYSMTREEAIIKVAEYTSENRELGGRILENPGFPVRMYHPLNQKKLMVEIENIISIEYLDVLNVYFDSILRIISTTDFSKELVKSNCSKMQVFGDDVDKSKFENVIASTGLSLIQPIKKIQPLSFDFSDDEDQEDEVDQEADQDEDADLLGYNLSKTQEDLEDLEYQDQEDDNGFMMEDFEPELDESMSNELQSKELQVSLPNITTIVSTPSLMTVNANPPTVNVNTMPIITKIPEQSVAKPSIAQSAKQSVASLDDDDDDDSGFMVEDYESEHSDDESGKGVNPLLENPKPKTEPTKEKEKEKEQILENDRLNPIKLGGEDTPSPEQNINIDGLSLHNIFLNRMKDKDPKLFLTKKEGKYSAYSKQCAANINRQPVILTDQEKNNIDEKNPGSYSNAVKYGSDPDNQFWYVCPRYWCLKTNSSISEADVKAGKCGTIIPQGSKTVPKGAYVYEFNSHTKEHVNTKGQYIEHYPSFFEDSHPDGHCIPCCFKLQQNESTGEWEMSKEQLRRRERCAKDVKEDRVNPATKFISYIKSAAIIPLEPKRWGFLPINAQLFLKTNNAAATVKTNAAQIKPDTKCLLRYGVEQVLNQSFLGCVAEMFGYKQGTAIPRVGELKTKMVEALTIDLFIKYHNGSLISIFRPSNQVNAIIDIDSVEFQVSTFVKSINVDDESQRDFLVDTIASYENFKKYILDEKQMIDHTYLWDMIIGQNQKFMKDGLNLIIMEVANNDITDKIELVCPTNSYSSSLYDPRKETVLVLKQGEFYEMIYLYEERGGEIHELKTFMNKPTALQNIVELLTLVQNSTKNYCPPQSSRPRIYNFNQNILANELYNLLTAIQYEIIHQVSNYQGKIIGLLTKHDDSDITIFLPCLPTNHLSDIPIKYMDEDIWTDYNTTLATLRKIKMDSDNRILCNPRIKVLEDGLIVGIITETNQFVQVSPLSENIGVEDGLEIIEGSNYLDADKVIETSKTPDLKRNDAIKKIALESNFFAIFRTVVRNILNQYENRELRKQILDLLDSPNKMYKQKLKLVVELLYDLVGEIIQFQDIAIVDLLTFDDITGCSKQTTKNIANNSSTSEKLYCLREGDKYNIPSKHLISNLDNEKIYYSRIADELIRYKRIRLFMFQTNFYLNITDSEYKIKEDEFIILQSIIGTDYFKGLTAFNSNPYIKNITYDVAEPSITQTYSNEIGLEEQDALENPAAKVQDRFEFTVECIKKRDKVIGNIQNSMWKRIFPKTVDEIVFKNSVSCSYYAIISVLQDRLKSVISIQNVKAFLWKGYNDLMEKYSGKIYSILKLQGKKDIVERINDDKATKIDLKTVIFSGEYYITDLDLWILAKTAQLPVVLFSSTKLNQLSPSIDWILLGGNVHDKLYFIRSPAQIVADTPPEYHLIADAFPFSELKEFRQIMEQAVAGSDFKQNIQSLESYLNAFTMFTKKKVAKK